jgi:glyoxylate carboligase
MNNNEGSKGCKYAFLVDQQWFAANFAHLKAVNKMESVPVVLEWWLDRWTFDLSKILLTKPGYLSCET